MILILLLKPRELQSVSRLTARAASLSLRSSFFQVTLSIYQQLSKISKFSHFSLRCTEILPRTQQTQTFFLCRTIIAREKPHSNQHSGDLQLHTIIGSYGPRDFNNILRRFSGSTDSDSWLRLKRADFPWCIRCSTPNSAAQFERPQSTTQPF